MKKKERNIIKNFITLEENISGEKQKLCDRYHELELSHKRKKNTLTKIHNFLNDEAKTARKYSCDNISFNIKTIEKLVEICENALFCDGRKNSKPFKYSKAWNYYKDRNPYVKWIKEQA